MFHPSSCARRDERRVLDKHGLTRGDYLLLPGPPSPGVNHGVAYEALRVLRDAYGLEPLLACPGRPDEASRDDLARIREAGLGARVRFLGTCPATDMPGLYAGAGALVMPSLVEAVGLPVLEAMWCDCPVVCAEAASLPEVAGPAALLVNPRSPEAVAHALSRVLADGDLRRALIERGGQRVRQFPGTALALGIASALHTARRLRYGSGAPAARAEGGHAGTPAVESHP
jgi:glycosyltransferase involved in cell wall biosynthesis